MEGNPTTCKKCCWVLGRLLAPNPAAPGTACHSEGLEEGIHRGRLLVVTSVISGASRCLTPPGIAASLTWSGHWGHSQPEREQTGCDSEPLVV